MSVSIGLLLINDTEDNFGKCLVNPLETFPHEWNGNTLPNYKFIWMARELPGDYSGEYFKQIKFCKKGQHIGTEKARKLSSTFWLSSKEHKGA